MLCAHTKAYTKAHKIMEIVEARAFRNNQEMYVDKADRGEAIIIKRKNKSYKRVPIGALDQVYPKELLEMIQQGEKDIKNGKTRSVTGKEEIRKLLGL